jgi:hypothetical protein
MGVSPLKSDCSMVYFFVHDFSKLQTFFILQQNVRALDGGFPSDIQALSAPI